MADDDCCLLSGPPNNFHVHESLGQFIFNSLNLEEGDNVINVDGMTKEVLTREKLLQDSINATGVLQSLGVQRGDIIAIISENNLNYCVPVVAALYMGVTVNPLNPGYATGELIHTLKICKPKLIICSELSIGNILKVKPELNFIENVILLKRTSENYLNIKSFEDLLKTTNVDVKNFTPETLDCSEEGAFVFLSSGTTGLPKGVFLTHQNLTSSFSYLHGKKYAGLVAGEVTLIVLPLFHIFGMLLQVAAISFHVKTILLDKFKPDIFLQCMQEYKATKLFVVPPLLLFLARSPLVDNYEMPSLRDIFVGAAPVSPQLEKDAKKRFIGVNIRQLYGSTEAAGACTFQLLDPHKAGSAGTLVPDMTAMVWDSNLNKKVGPLKTGELCFRGTMIMKGYVGNAAASEECIDKEGFYHTGDMGYFDQDGHFFIVDRMKELIKYKGFQVSPAELEGLLLQHPAVKDCGVIGIPDERSGQLPRAYIVRQNGTSVTEQDIVDYVAGRISVQKHLYGGVAFLEEIPKNASGKILRRKLMDTYKDSCANGEISNGVNN